MKKSSSSNTEHNDDIGPNSSAHNIGLLLSKYDNFMAKRDIISPSKIIDQKKRILQTLNLELIEVFGEYSELVEKNAMLATENDPSWELKLKEEFSNKYFLVFTNKKNPNKGRFLMTFQDKRPDELMAVFVDQTVWDKSLVTRQQKQFKKTKETFVREVYKPCETLKKHKELVYLSFSNKLKNHHFILGKSVDEIPVTFDDTISIEQVQRGHLHKLMVSVSSYVSEGLCHSSLFLEVELSFILNQDTQSLRDLNSKLVLNYLENFKAFHYFMIPNGVLLKTPFLQENIPKGQESMSRESESSSEKYEQIQILKKDAPSYSKGNAETYADLVNLENFYKYFHNGYHILDCILNYHQIGLLEDCEEKVESNVAQGHFAFKKDYARGKKGGLNYLNAELMTEQKRVILNLLKQAGSNLIHGRGVINISLPVGVFEPRSFLERLARSFGHAPIFLEKAGMTNNIIEQMKLTVAFFLSSMVLCIQQEKPFNPILGETFQGRMNGCPIYLEQLKHHPAVTYYYMIGRNYKLYGTHEPVANLSANTLQAEQRGNPAAEFLNNKTKVYFRWPLFIINGTAMGQRSFNFFSKAIAYNKENNYLCEVLFNVNEVSGLKGLFQKRDYFIDEIGGGIYKVKPEVITKYESSKKPFKLELNYETDVVETISKITGQWTSKLEFDGVKYWDIDNDRPFLLEYEQNCLPSDSNFRDDVLFLRMGKKEEAQLKKNEGENSQRYDKKLRDNYKKKAHKKP